MDENLCFKGGGGEAQLPYRKLQKNQKIIIKTEKNEKMFVKNPFWLNYSKFFSFFFKYTQRQEVGRG